MSLNKKNSFTFVELLMVIAIIGILMLGMTIYLGNSGSRAKTIEAEGCSNALGGTLGNYAYFALTSKNLRLTNNKTFSPTYYYIQLTGGNTNSENRCSFEGALSGFLCNEIILGYATGYFSSGVYDPDLNIQEYQKINVSNTCRHGKSHLRFYRSGGQYTGNIEFIRMNKGFTPREVKAEKVFFLKDNSGKNEDDTKLLTGDIIILLCGDASCSCTNGICGKQIGKRQVDARSQTISFKKCRYFFDGTEDNICKTRENCRVYDNDDPTVCKEY